MVCKMIRFLVFSVLSQIIFCGSSAFCRDKHSIELKGKNQIGISYEECLEMENKIGPLLFIGVGAYGAPGQTIDRLWIETAQDLNVGGSLPHFGSRDPVKIREALQKLQSGMKDPMLIGVDYVSYDIGDQGISNGFGYGHRHAAAEIAGPECAAKHDFLVGLLHRGIGVHPLGPTIENHPNSKFNNDKRDFQFVEQTTRAISRELRGLGLISVAKHYPFDVEGFDSHRYNTNIESTKEEIEKRLKIWQATANDFSVIMSTHLLARNIDPKDMATFSSVWIDRLKKEFGFKGLVMTDEIYMFRAWPDDFKNNLLKWERQEPIEVTDPGAILTARALMAGHDMVLLHGENKEAIYRVFNQLHYISCQKTKNGETLRARIRSAYQNVQEFKSKHKDQLTNLRTLSNSILIRADKLVKDAESVKLCTDPDTIKEYESIRTAALAELKAPAAPVESSVGVTE